MKEKRCDRSMRAMTRNERYRMAKRVTFCTCETSREERLEIFHPRRNRRRGDDWRVFPRRVRRPYLLEGARGRDGRRREDCRRDQPRSRPRRWARGRANRRRPTRRRDARRRRRRRARRRRLRDVRSMRLPRVILLSRTHRSALSSSATRARRALPFEKEGAQIAREGLGRLPPATTPSRLPRAFLLTRVAASSTSIAIALSRALALSHVPFRALGRAVGTLRRRRFRPTSRPRRARRRASLTDRRVRLRDARRRRHGRRRRRRRRRGRARHRRGRRERRALRRELPKLQSEFNLSSRLALAQSLALGAKARVFLERDAERVFGAFAIARATSSPSRWDPSEFRCR